MTRRRMPGWLVRILLAVEREGLMGVFESVRRRGARGRAETSAQELATLRAKYRAVLAAVESARVRVQNLHAVDGRLYVKGVAPSDAVRAHILDEVRRAGGDAGDIVVELSVAPACAPPDEVH